MFPVFCFGFIFLCTTAVRTIAVSVSLYLSPQASTIIANGSARASWPCPPVTRRGDGGTRAVGTET